MLDAVEDGSAPAPVHPVTHAAFREIPWHLFGTLAAGRSQVVFRTPYLDNEIVRLAYRAPGRLRLSAAPALRLIHRQDPALASIPTDQGLVWDKRGPRRHRAPHVLPGDVQARLSSQGRPARLARTISIRCSAHWLDQSARVAQIPSLPTLVPTRAFGLRARGADRCADRASAVLECPGRFQRSSTITCAVVTTGCANSTPS